jgi:hypothetical protein
MFHGGLTRQSGVIPGDIDARRSHREIAPEHEQNLIVSGASDSFEPERELQSPGRTKASTEPVADPLA